MLLSLHNKVKFKNKLTIERKVIITQENIKKLSVIAKRSV